MHSRFGFQAPSPGGYRLRPELGGGIFRNSASYWLQALQEITGLPEAGGTGTARCSEPEGVDHAFEAELPLRGGVMARLSCSFAGRHLAEFSRSTRRASGFAGFCCPPRGRYR
ncbi:hypothetical protein ACIQAD_34430 [Streptomyces sp. NPDC088551]|uniref:Gfo/Idh/MocA family protein n=1 Tax=Streptomyces sp. NPDC088551 TaxID=3365863 RepID=UPI003818550A